MAGNYTSAELSVTVTGEKQDLLQIYADQRNLLMITVRGLTDEQARTRSTVSELTLGGILKHVAIGEQDTAREIVERDENAEVDLAALGDAYTFTADDTLDHWLSAYRAAAAEFERVIADIDSLDELIPQATAPWTPERQWWSVRQIVLHRLRETAHHCGHADILREALDGQTTMAVVSEGIEWPDDT
ncbi:DUF664 domain-containing protein [Gordonia alkaliphila]|uniref:DinB family protein n=1 Tax=Gordonia alkaliphila TaxID=1053547 RepID=A0ABP8ZD31_9ACTN